jgi:hypothetical protein
VRLERIRLWRSILSCVAAGRTVLGEGQVYPSVKLGQPTNSVPLPRADALSNAVCSEVNAHLIRMMMVMVAARSNAISGIIAGMLAFVHTFTIGAVNFSAVGFSDIFVTLSCNRILIAVLITVLVSAFITSSPLAA